MPDLRQKLDEITQCVDLESQVSLMEQLRPEFNHHIFLQQKFNRDIEKQYNCFMYAFDIPYRKEIRDILRKNLKINFGIKFIQRLIDKGILISNKNGLIVIYFKDGNPVHAGKYFYSKNRVISKWGKGHLWEHDIHEVPMSYGNKQDFFDPIKSKFVIKEFKKFVAENKIL